MPLLPSVTRKAKFNIRLFLTVAVIVFILCVFHEASLIATVLLPPYSDKGRALHVNNNITSTKNDTFTNAYKNGRSRISKKSILSTSKSIKYSEIIFNLQDENEPANGNDTFEVQLQSGYHKPSYFTRDYRTRNVFLSRHLRERDRPSDDAYNINVSLSDLLPLNRPFPPPQGTHCSVVYSSPISTKVSVVIPFYNEPLSTLLRTVYSVVLHTPQHTLHEIILVDDCSSNSDNKHLQGMLPSFVQLLWQFNFNIGKASIVQLLSPKQM